MAAVGQGLVFIHGRGMAMKILIIGGSGVLGRNLIPLLLADGHDVTATRRHPQKDVAMPEGARFCELDLLDEAAVQALLVSEKPDVVFHMATAMPADLHPRKLRKQLAMTNRLRDEGTRHLLAAAHAAGVKRIIAESVAFAYAPEDGPADEAAPLVSEPLAGFGDAVAAIRSMEKRLLDAGDNVALRLGMLYGPGTSYDENSATAKAVRKKQFPIVNPGTGRFSFLHVADAAEAFRKAVSVPAGVYNVCENRNLGIGEWLPDYASALGAPQPIRVPRWLGRLAAGPFGDFLMNRQRGASNARARQVLGWEPEHDFLSGSVDILAQR